MSRIAMTFSVRQGDRVMTSCVVNSFLKFVERDMRRHFDNGLAAWKIHLYVSNSFHTPERRFDLRPAALATHSGDCICMFHSLPMNTSKLRSCPGECIIQFRLCFI